MPPRRRRPAGIQELVWDFSVVCIGLIVFMWAFHSSVAEKSIYVVPNSPKSSVQSSLAPLARSSRATSAQSHLMLVRGDEELGEGDISNEYVHNFDVVGSLTKIVGHPRRFLRAKYVNTARVLSENVTAPAFGRSAWGRMPNETAELEGWLISDTAGICYRAITGIGYNIASLTLQHLRCLLTDLPGQHPAIEAAGEEADSKDPGHGRCSPENVQKWNKLLHSFWVLEKSVLPACDEVQTTILSNLGTLHRFRRHLMSTTAGVVSELKILLDLFASLSRVDGDMNDQPEELVQHLLHNSSMSGVRLEALASRSGTRYPGDLDPFTALVLHFILGSGLFISNVELLFNAPPQYVVDGAKAGQQLPIRNTIRRELDRQAHTFNKSLELF